MMTRLGLLKARRRSTRGYRLYRMKELERIGHIVAMKFLGLPLSEIRRVLDGEPLFLLQALVRQQAALREKRQLLDRALVAIGEAQPASKPGKPAAVLWRRIIETIPRQMDANGMMNCYSPTAQAKRAERAASFTPERQAQLSEAWKEYCRALAALKEQDHSEGAKAAARSQRHEERLAAFTGNDADSEAGLTALYRDRENGPAERKDRRSEYEDATVD